MVTSGYVQVGDENKMNTNSITVTTSGSTGMSIANPSVGLTLANTATDTYIYNPCNWTVQPYVTPKWIVPNNYITSYITSYGCTIKNNGDEKPMKNLMNVVVVTIDEEIILDKKVIASDQDEAKFLAGVDTVLREKKLLPKEVTVICSNLGQVKVKKEITEVKVIKE